MDTGRRFRHKALSLLTVLSAALVMGVFSPAASFAGSNITIFSSSNSLSSTAQTSSSISIQVAFTDTKCGSGGATGAYNAAFTWEYSLDGVSNWQVRPTPGSAAASPYTDTITGLSAGTRYYIRVKIQDAEGVDYSACPGQGANSSLYTNTISVFTTGNNGTTTGSLTSPSQTVSTVDLVASYTYDDNQNNSISFQYEYPSGVWNTISGATVNRGTRTWSATATGLNSNTPYNFRATFTDGDSVTGTNPVTGTWSTAILCESTVNDCADCHSMPPSAGSHLVSGHSGAGTRSNCAVCHFKYTGMVNVTSSARWTTGHTNLYLDIYTSNGVQNNIFAAPYNMGIKGGYYKGYRNKSSLWKGGSPNANNTCTATYCHGAGDSPVWGSGVTTCVTCHAQPPAGGKHTTHTQGYAGYDNKSNSGSYNFGCYKCHDKGSVTHASGPASANQAAPVAFDNRTSPKNPSGGYTPGGSTAGTDGTLKWTDGTCASLYCHSDGNGGNAASPTWNGTLNANCTGCHKGNKAAGAGNIMASGKHTEHVNNTDANLAAFGCVKCHNRTVSADTTLSNRANHVNQVKDVYFSSFNGYTGSYAGGSCNNNYCHSSGQVTPAFRTPSWSGAALNCDGCHGAEGTVLVDGAPEYTNQSTASRNSFNSHDKHAKFTSDCVKCHTQTVDGTCAIIAGSQHLSGAREVNFAKGGNYNTTTKRCDSTDCHGVTAIRWGGSLPASCNSCHSDQGAGTNGSHAYTGKHSKHTSTYGFACEACHATTNAVLNTSHAGGDVSLKHAAQVYFNTTATVWTNMQYGGGGTTFKYIQMDSAYGLSGLNPVYTPWTTMAAQSDPLSANRKWTEGKCSTTWCHSNANPLGGTMQYAQFANWSTAETTTCTSCHGGSNTYANVVLSPTHKKHIGTDRYNFTCSECHFDTVASGNSPVSSYAKHVNSSKDVKFDGTNPSGTYTSPNCASLSCHSNGTAGNTGSAVWNGAATTCTSCHSYSTLGGATSKHDEHIAQGNIGTFKCGDCHRLTVQSNNTTINYAGGLHVNGTRDVYFKAMNGYTGLYTASFTCRNNYCHSSGQATPNFRTTAAWSSATTYGCKECHGADTAFTAPYGEPNYANISTATRNTFNGHSSHVTAASDCVKCHNQTVDGTSAIIAGSKHLSGSREVSFAKGGNYNNTTKRCDSTDCHGVTAIRWGGTLPASCNSCHSDQGAGTNGSHAYTGKHSKHTNTYGFACEVCHATKNATLNTSHAGGDVSLKHAAQVYFNTTATVWTNMQYGGGGTTFKYIQMDSAYGLSGLNPVYTPWTTMAAQSDPLSANRKWTEGKCSTTWCHSNANPLGGTMQYVQFANWSTAETTTCKSCHGGSNTYANVVLSPTHKKHIGTDRYNLACSVCHNDTVSSGNSPVSSYTKHVNSTKDVKFDGTNPSGTYTSPNCASLSCHSNGTAGNTGSAVWNGAATTCTSCHNYTKATTPMGTGAHTAHINQGNLGKLLCVDCHKLTVLANNTTIIYSNNLHVNGSANVSMKLFNTYTGAYTASKTCRNVYCHSTGQSIPVVSTTPVWGSGSLNCDGCHGVEGTTLVAGAPEYANVSTANRNTFNGHQVTGHVSATTDCVKCHNQTVDSTSTILSTGLHINGSRNVNFQLGGTYDSVNKRCSNTDVGCHGTTVMRWGGTGSCVDCHQVLTADVDDYTYNNGTKAVINFYEYTSVGHGKKGTYSFTGRAGANLSCLDCHSLSVPHGSATNPFRLINADTNALCLTCHTTGIANHDLAHVGQGTWAWTPKCVDCHDPHGDTGGVTSSEKNAAMVQSKVAYTGSDAYGVPGTTPEGVDFPANYARARSLAAFNWSSFVVSTGQSNKGICRVCHTQASTSYFTRTVSGTHEAGSSCVTCHSHSSGFQPPACNSCHGNPPNIADGKTDTAGAVGAHDKHVTVLGMSCYDCHKGNQHNQLGVSAGYSGALTPGFVNMSVTSTYKFKGSLPNYNGTPGSWSTAKNCSNVNCHYGQSKNWDCQ